jgi:hypothetical protein
LKEALEAIKLFAVHFAIYCLQKAQFFTKARFILWAFPDSPGRVLLAEHTRLIEPLRVSPHSCNAP